MPGAFGVPALKPGNGTPGPGPAPRRDDANADPATGQAP